MGTEYKGYGSLIDSFKLYQKQTPKGVSLQSKRNKTILLRFRFNDKPKAMGCNCTFTLDGMVSALSKAHKVAEALKSFTSESEFWEWYDKEIKEIGKIENDLLTFRDAIALIEDEFWNGLDKRGERRYKDDPSCQKSWYDAYGTYFRRLSLEKIINWDDIKQEIDNRKVGTNRYKESIRVFKKMARLTGNNTILNKLNKLKTVQTEFREQQEIDLEDFIEWRDKVLGITQKLHANRNLDTRRKGLWVLGMQIIYGLRISEVFAIKNLDKPAYDPKTHKLILHPYNDLERNPHRLLYIGKRTILGTTVKTGARLARPMESPRFPNLYYDWDLHNPKLPENKPEKDSQPTTWGCFYANLIGGWLRDWKAPFSQTHADRRLGNLLGMQAGIPQEIRAKSLGHNPAFLTNSVESLIAYLKVDDFS